MTVAVVVFPVVVHLIVMTLPQYGLVFDNGPINAYGRATIFSLSPLVTEPQAPSPAVNQVMSPLHGLAEAQTLVSPGLVLPGLVSSPGPPDPLLVYPKSPPTGLQPVPQNVPLYPQNPDCEQQLPYAEPLQVTLEEQVRSVLTVRRVREAMLGLSDKDERTGKASEFCSRQQIRSAARQMVRTDLALQASISILYNIFHKFQFQAKKRS